MASTASKVYKALPTLDGLSHPFDVKIHVGD